MTRKIVSDALAQAASAAGYAFHSGADYRIPTSIVAYPALWLTPPAIIALEGTHAGRIRYALRFHLMRITPKKEQPGDPWEPLEADALAIHRLLRENRALREVEFKNCTPGEFALTNHGEVSVEVRMEVEAGFCELKMEN